LDLSAAQLERYDNFQRLFSCRALTLEARDEEIVAESQWWRGGVLTRPSPRALITALSGCLAALIALYIAFALDLPNPYWSMVTVYIVQSAGPLTGAIWAKAAYRVAGTVIGAAASVVLIPNLVDAPPLMILALGGWIGLCTFGGSLDRSPRSYLFILSGYTVTIVGLPAAVHPDAIFNLAVARGEEIIIGVLAPAVVQSILFPRSVALEMSARLDGVMADARAWIAKGLRDLKPAPTPRHLAAQLTEIDLLATDWRFEGTFSQPRRRALWALGERLITLLPLISAVEDRLAAIGETAAAPPQLRVVTSRLAAWVEAAGETSAEANRLIADEIRTMAPPLGPASTWADILAASLSGRLTELLTAWQECALLAAVVQSPSPRLRAPATPLIAEAKPRALHVDPGIALLSGLVAALTVIGALAFSVAIRWEEAPVAIVFAAVCCSLFAAADDPTPTVWQLLTGLLVALPLALLYELAILPAIDGFVMLAVALFPAVMTLGLLLTYQSLSIRALGAIIAFSTGLALESRFAPDLAGFLNFYLGMVLGPIFALIGMSLARILPAHRVIRRILRASWGELALLAGAPSVPSRIVWTSRMLDRVGLLLPRLSSIGTDEDVQLSKVLRDLRLGVSVVELRRVRAMLDEDARRDVDAVLAELATHFNELSRGASAAAPTHIVDVLDAVITAALKLADAEDRYAGVGAALGLRRALSSKAPGHSMTAARS
jgi:uncharacterized membrane protein YccC